MKESRMPRVQRTAIREDSGQALVEYVVILSFVALLAVTGLTYFVSHGINSVFTSIGNSI
jgi:Flp pilus assembly pilin Flp